MADVPGLFDGLVYLPPTVLAEATVIWTPDDTAALADQLAEEAVRCV